MGKREKHARSLARKLGVRLTLFRRKGRRWGIDGSANRREGVYVIAERWNQLTYFAALHELGHIALHHVEETPTWRYRCDTVECEAEAWLWALNQSKERPSAHTVDFILSQESFGGYARHYPNWIGEHTLSLYARLGEVA